MIWVLFLCHAHICKPVATSRTLAQCYASGKIFRRGKSSFYCEKFREDME